MKNQWKYLALGTLVVAIGVSTNSVYVSAYTQAENNYTENQPLKNFYLAQQGGFIMSDDIECDDINNHKYNNTEEPHDDDQTTWEKTKEMSSDVWEKTKEMSSDAWEATKDGAEKAWDKTKEVTHKIVD